VALIGIGALVGFLLGLWSLTGLGRSTTVACQCVLWAIRQMFTWPTALFVCLWLVLVATVFFAWRGIVLVVACSAAALILIPFGVFRNDVVAGPRIGPWWRLQWPGWRVVGSVVLLVIGRVTLGWLLNLGGLPAVLRFVGGLPLALFGLAAAAVFLSRDPRWLRRPSLFRVDRLVAWYSLELAWVIFLAPLAAPALSVYIVLWKVVPVLGAIAVTQGDELPLALRLAVGAVKFIGRYYWAALLVPLGFLELVSSARLSGLLGFQPPGQVEGA
jgi:hypothetical protein